MSSPLDFTQPHGRPFDFSRYLFDEGVARLLKSDPNTAAIFRAGFKAGYAHSDGLTVEQRERADEIAEAVIRDMHTRDGEQVGQERLDDDDAAGYSDALSGDYQAGYEDGYTDALRAFGIEPDDGPDGAA